MTMQNKELRIDVYDKVTGEIIAYWLYKDEYDMLNTFMKKGISACKELIKNKK